MFKASGVVLIAPLLHLSPAWDGYSSGVARKNFLPRQSYTLTKLRGSISDSNDSQILLSIGGTALAGWMKELNRFRRHWAFFYMP